MAIADMIPTLDDDALASLRANAERLSAGAPGPKTDEAAALLPLVETELAAREALKPPKAVKARISRSKAAKAAEAAEAAQAEEDAEEAQEAEVAELA
jgi:hypothetical protein